MRAVAGIAAVLATVMAVGVASGQEGPRFQLGFKLLADQIPEVVGEPLEDEHHGPASGDGLQLTTRGLMVWREADNSAAFTDGYRSWVSGPEGVQLRMNGERFEWEQLDESLPIAATPTRSPGKSSSGIPVSVPAGGPDGRILMVVRNPRVYTGLVPNPSTVPVPSDIWIMNPDGTGQTRIAIGDARYPAWVPGCRRISFVSKDDLYVMDADGSHKVRLTEGGLLRDTPGYSWSPDGRRIVAFIGVDSRKPSDLLFLDLTDGSQRRQAGPPMLRWGPSWSPDGSKIAFALSDGLQHQVAVMNSDGTSLVILTENGDNEDPAWSPDGKRIAFVSNRDGRNNELYVMNADGSQITRVTRDLAIKYRPSWSWDGTRIVFEERGGRPTDREPSVSLGVVNVDGTGRERNMSSDAYRDLSVWHPSWSCR